MKTNRRSHLSRKIALALAASMGMPLGAHAQVQQVILLGRPFTGNPLDPADIGSCGQGCHAEFGKDMRNGAVLEQKSKQIDIA